jgi:hypothetical protein
MLSSNSWFCPLPRKFGGEGFFASRLGKQTVVSLTIEVDTEYTIKAFPSDNFIINDTIYTALSSGTSKDTTPLYMFTYGGNPGDSQYTGKSQVYYCKIWQDGELVRDFIPVLDEDNVACLYDLVTESYFYNIGTGDFLSGGIVIEPSVTPIPVSNKYLIRSGTDLYTINNNVLTKLDIVDVLAENFLAYGFDIIPDGSLLLELINPEVLFWKSAEDEEDLPVLKATMTATPYPQTVVTNPIDLSHPTILGIQCVTVTCTGNPLFACSFDDGITWKVHNGTSWSDMTNNNGMTKAVLEAITTEQWAQAVEGLDSFKLWFILNTIDDTVTNVIIDYVNEGE